MGAKLLTLPTDNRLRWPRDCHPGNLGANRRAVLCRRSNRDNEAERAMAANVELFILLRTMWPVIDAAGSQKSSSAKSVKGEANERT